MRAGSLWTSFGGTPDKEPAVNRQTRIRPAPRRRPRPVDVAPLAVAGFTPDTTAADELIDRIAAILEIA